jgi:hypothetical protein
MNTETLSLVHSLNERDKELIRALAILKATRVIMKEGHTIGQR